jgi:heat shock protein HslJ
MVRFRNLLYGLIGFVVLSSAACSTQIPLLPITGGQLEGTQWQLNSYGPRGSEVAVEEGAQITMAFTSQDKVGGTDGCNMFEGNYQAQYGEVLFRNLQSREAACQNQALTNQELEYLQALSRSNRYEIRGNQLIIWYDNGKNTLIFTRSHPPGLVGASLEAG